MRITVGGRGENVSPADGAAHERGELLVDDLDDLLAGVERPSTSAPSARSLTVA